MNTNMTHQAFSASEDGDEVGVLFNRSSLSFETAFKWLLYFQSLVNNQNSYVLKDGKLI